jgi:hypothetical protein
MSDKKSEKVFIVGDIHGNADLLKKDLKDISFEIDKKPIINVGSPPEHVPEGKIPDFSNIMEEVEKNIKRIQKANDDYHSEQYIKMYPKKPK